MVRGANEDAELPAHRSPRVLLAVAVGGAVGGPLRYGLGLALPAAGSGLPRGTLVVNLLGCLLLGVLTEALARRARPGSRTATYARPLLGSGVLGAFTTYSALAVETDLLLASDRAGVAVAYVVMSVLGGLLAALTGTLLARRVLA